MANCETKSGGVISADKTKIPIIMNLLFLSNCLRVTKLNASPISNKIGN